MLIFKLEGGLGNQLFQYAFARSLSYDLDKELFLDISRYGFNIPVKHLIYCLHPFSIKAVVGYYPPETFLENKSFKGPLHIYEKGIPLTEYSLYREGKIEKEVKNIEFPAYFTGYFSAGFDENNFKVFTEKFFIHNEELIRKDLTYLPEISDEFKHLIKEIEESNSVAIHIRRGEYKDLENFGTCSVAYYQKAINEIVSKVENPKFFIFSEDQEWVKKNINIPFPHKHVYFNRQKHGVSAGYAELLKVFSSCNHFIIANSTFSWWGAWLGENQDKIIISPYPWYQSRELLYTETISNKKPILIENTYKEIFNGSDKIIFNLDDYISGEGFVSSQDFKQRIDNNLIDEHSRIHIPKIEKNRTESLMIKISMQTSSNDNLTIFHKSKQTKLKYFQFNLKEMDNFEKPFKIFYYVNDEFEQYVPIPKTVKLDSILIQLSNNPNSQFLLKSLEIRAIKQHCEPEEKIPFAAKDYDYYEKIKFNKLNHAMQDSQVSSIMSKFIKARVDLKNTGSKENSVVIEKSEGNIISEYPPWWQWDDGKGLVVNSTSGHINIRIRCVKDGLLNIFLRTMDVRDDTGRRIPIYLKYTEFKVNGQDVLGGQKFVHHDKPVSYKREVNDSEILDISVKWDPI